MDFADILVVIFAIVGAVISAIAKNAKKKAGIEQDMLPTFDSYEEPENELQEHRQGIPEQGRDIQYTTRPISHQDRELHTLETPVRQHWSYDQQAIAEVESSRLVNDTYRPKRNINKSGDALNSLSEGKKEGIPDGILKDVNVKDIVIYSELLKPKFQDY